MALGRVWGGGVLSSVHGRGAGAFLPSLGKAWRSLPHLMSDNQREGFPGGFSWRIFLLVFLEGFPVEFSCMFSL